MASFHIVLAGYWTRLADDREAVLEHEQISLALQEARAREASDDSHSRIFVLAGLDDAVVYEMDLP